MLTKGVQYAHEPERVNIRRHGNGYMCTVELAENVRQEQGADGDAVWIADVYSLDAGYTAGIRERVERDRESWLAIAREIPVPKPTIEDVVDALNALTEAVIGGM